MNRQKLRQGVVVFALGVWMLYAADPQKAFAHQGLQIHENAV